MNFKMELSDYQVIAGLLDLPQISTSKTYAYSSTVADKGYHTNMQLEAKKKSAEQKHLQQLECIRDEEEMAEAHNMQEFNNFIVEDSTNYSSDNIEESSSDCDDDDSTSEIIGSFSANVDNTSSVAQSRGSRDEERSVAVAGHGIHPQEHHDDIGAGTGEYGHLLAFDERDPDNPEKVMNHCWVPVPALHCNHGADLKQLNQEEYCALVNYKSNTAAKHSAGRSPIKKFPFATMLPYAVQYVQFLQQKQKTVIYTRKAPRYPGLPLTVPYSRQKYKQWKKQADQFAQYYLTAYHPEVEGYAAGDMTANPDHEEMD